MINDFCHVCQGWYLLNDVCQGHTCTLLQVLTYPLISEILYTCTHCTPNDTDGRQKSCMSKKEALEHICTRDWSISWRKHCRRTIRCWLIMLWCNRKKSTFGLYKKAICLSPPPSPLVRWTKYKNYFHYYILYTGSL
jgi:hypothetical protein